MKKLAVIALLSIATINCHAEPSKSKELYNSSGAAYITVNNLDDAYEKLAKIAKQQKKGIYVAFKNAQGDQWGKYTPSTFNVDQFRSNAMQELRNNSANRIEIKNSSGQILGYIIVVLDQGILTPEQVANFLNS